MNGNPLLVCAHGERPLEIVEYPWLYFSPHRLGGDSWGMVTPYLADIQDLEKGGYSKFPQFLDYFQMGLEPELQPKF